MSKPARSVWMAVAGLLLVACVAYAATPGATPIPDGTAVLLIPDRDAVKLGPQPEPPDLPATAALALAPKLNVDVDKLSPQPEPPDYPTNMLRRLLNLLNFFGR